MGSILIMEPMDIAAISASRGSGAANLLTPDPKEVWQDSASGSVAMIDIDLGSERAIDTVALIAAQPAAAAASWSIDSIKAIGPLRALDSAGQAPALSHGLWHGVAVTARNIRIRVTQPAGQPPLSIGRLLIGRAFIPTYNKEWGSGRQVIDTGTATPLPSGGYAIVEGTRKGSYSWTLGDLLDGEVEQLYAIQMACGETRPVLVVEDPAETAGLRNRIHYGKFSGLKAYDRRNPVQTRWEMGVEDWV